MKQLQNKTLQEFINRLVNVLKEENKEREQYCKRKLDIPYIISTLYQSFDKKEDKYENFIKNLEEWNDYGLVVYKSQNDYDGIIDVQISLLKYEQYEEDWYQNYNYPDYDYLIHFTHEERNWGFCECTPDMEDYREDKMCCGHGCDASFCKFELKLIKNEMKDEWNGDKHDYWLFEEEFYESEEELNKKKKEEERIAEIDRLKKQIEDANNKLKQLEENNDDK